MSITTEKAPLYPQRDIEAMGDVYLRHVSAMTTEGLNSKSDIAAQLAWRDVCIAELEAALAKDLAPINKALEEGEFKPGQWTVSACRAIEKNPSGALVIIRRLKRDLADARAQAERVQQVPEPQAARDEIAEAIRRRFVTLMRFSFYQDDNKNIRKVPDQSGNWVEFDAAHTLFDPVCVDEALCELPRPMTFKVGDMVKKKSGSQWVGRVVGWYSTTLTSEGFAVESIAHPGSVQIYPVNALELIIEKD